MIRINGLILFSAFCAGLTGCDYWDLDGRPCKELQVYYRDNDGDGLGRVKNRKWSCMDGPPEGYVAELGDLCEDTTALNWDGNAFEPCVHETDGECEPVEYYGIVYDVFQLGNRCYFADDLKTKRFQNGDSLRPDNSPFSPQYVEGANSGFLYYRRMAEEELCPTGWRVWNYYDVQRYFLDEIKRYVEFLGPALRSREGWHVEGTDWWGFNAVPTGSYDLNSGTFHDDERAIYMILDPEAEWTGNYYNLIIDEGNEITFLDSWGSFPEADQIYGAIRCVKYL